MSTTPNPALMPLYTDELFFIPESVALPLPQLGNFEKKVMLLYAENEMNPSNDEMLRKMMNSCKLEEKDYYRLGITSEKQIANLVKHYQPETLILFGLKWQQGTFHIQKNPYTPFRFAGMKCLFSDSLNTLQSRPDLKKELWNNGLKYLFKIV